MFVIIFTMMALSSHLTFATSTQQGCMMCHQGNDDDTESVKQHVRYLTQDKLEGRLTGSQGERLANQYVADFLKSHGYEAAGDHQGYFQTFRFLTPTHQKKKQLKML